MVGVLLLCMTQGMKEEKASAAAWIWMLGMVWSVGWDIYYARKRPNAPSSATTPLAKTP
jgi:hypothetical protein